MVRAWEGFRYKDYWRKLQERAMKMDFSWYRSTEEYVKIYKDIKSQPPELSPEEAEILKQLTLAYQ
jgi:starch synthase